MPGKICKECGFELSNGHSLACSERTRLAGLQFHIESQDYFGTLATVISLCQQEQRKIPESVIEDLVYLQENYKIIEK